MVSMSFGAFAMASTQDCFVGSVLGIEDGFCSQNLDLHQLLEYPRDNNLLQASSSSSFSCGGSLPADMVQSLSFDLEKQRLEMDWFLQMENKRLATSILQQESRLQAFIMQKYETTINSLMRQKDEELAVARIKSIELQGFMEAAEMEAKGWEKKATEKEAIISHLNNRLNQAQNRDTASFCDSSSSTTTGDQEPSKRKKKVACKLCQSRNSCVVFFPCRHLCCCKSCEPLLWHCPVCQTVKEASLEVILA